jgi:hypothetical protein
MSPDAILLTPTEAAQRLWERWRLRRSARRLQQLRRLGAGPVFLRDGVRALYRQSNLDTWAAGVLGEPIVSTSQEAALDHVRAAAAARRAARSEPTDQPTADTTTRPD